MHRLPDAIAATLAVFSPLGAERVSLFDAAGRRLAHDVTARAAVPPFDASAMDGYAIRAADVADGTEASPASLRVAFAVPAGRPNERAVMTGEAARILTGGAMPDGADAVVIQENTTRDGDRLLVRIPPVAGANLRRAGSDIAVGSPLLGRGAWIDAGAVAMLASQGLAQPVVSRRPVVAILPTGDELRGLGDAPSHGSIVDSNAPMLAALVAREGGIPRIVPIVRDDRAAIAAAIAANLDADLVLTTGGVSVGDCDHVPDAMLSLGAEVLVRKVRMKPGKPITVATLAGRPLLGLPGNPVSAMVGFELFVAPGLRRMQGDPTPFAEGELLPVAHDVRRSTGRPELARANYVLDGNRRAVDLSRTQGSGSLRALTDCDAFVVFGPDTASVATGEPVFVVPVGARGRSAVTPLAARPEFDPGGHG